MNSLCPFRAVLVATCVVIAPTHSAAQSTPQDIVDQFYPTNRLSADSDDRKTCFAVHTSVNGDPTVIIAGYTDLYEGVARVLIRDAGGAYGVGYEVPTTYEMTGSGCSVTLLDVDFDGQPEALLDFAGRRGTEGWLFRWTGTQLTNLTPTTITADREQSRLFSPNVIDATHSGWMQIVCPGSPDSLDDNEPAPYPDEVYEATNGVYARTRFVLGVRHFREGSDPRAKVFHFRRSEDSVGPFVLRVTNGDRIGQHRVATAVISLNDIAVVDASQLTSATEFVNVTIADLPVENTIIVSMTGDDDSTITVSVADSTVRIP